MPHSPRHPDDLFFAARELEADEREVFLRRECKADATLRAAIEDLLSADAQADADAFLTDLDLPAEHAAEPKLAGHIGQSIGPYRIERELGRGAQATVYLAYDTALERPVALKVLATLQHADRASTMAQRFRREANALANVEHPALCTIYDAGVDGGVAWIAMRYIDGRTLAELLAADRTELHCALATGTGLDHGDTDTSSGTGTKNRSPLLRIASVFEQIARALHAAHQRGVVHRDVKPGNVMITATGRPVLLDFGIAHAMDDDNGPGLTQTSDVLGTPAYMAPEQIRAQGKIDARSDVYGLAVTLYECLAGRRPFEAVSREAVYHQILGEAPPSLCSLVPGMPRDLEVVVMTALDKDQDRRYSSAAEFADDLRRVYRFEPIRARPIRAVGRMWRWAKRQPMVAASLGFAFVALAGGLAVSLYALGSANAAVSAFEAERWQRFEALSRSVALASDRGKPSMAIPEWRRLTAQLLDETDPGFDLHAVLADLAIPDRLTIDANMAKRAIADLRAWSSRLEGPECTAAADVLIYSMHWLVTFCGYYPPGDKAVVEAATALADLRLELLMRAPKGPMPDPRILRASVMVLDMLTVGGQAQRAADLATEWLAVDSPFAVLDRPTHRAVYESRLGMAELRLGKVQQAHERLARCVPVVVQAFFGTTYDVVALAAATESSERSGKPEIWPEQRREIARRIVATDLSSLTAPWWVWETAFRPEDKELLDFVVDGMLSFTRDKASWTPELTTSWCEQCLRRVGDHLDAEDPLRLLVARFVKYIHAVGYDVHGFSPRREGLAFSKTTIALHGVTIDPVTGGPVIPENVRRMNYDALSGAMLYVANGQWADDRQLQRAKLWYQATMDLVPDDTVWHHRLAKQYGVLLRDTGHYEEAERRILRSIELDEAWFGIEHQDWVNDDFNALARMWQQRGRYEEAVRWHQRHLRDGKPRSHHLLAWTHLGFGRTQEARRWAKATLAIDPDYGPAMRVLAHVALIEKHYDEAIAWADRAIAHGTKHAWHVRAHALTARGEFGDAEAALESFRQAPWTFSEWSDKAATLFLAGDTSVKERMVEVATKRDDALEVYGTARFLLAIDDKPGALHFAERAAKLCNYGRARVIALLAEAQFRNGMITEARQTALRCDELMAGQDAFWFSLADARLQFARYD